jgi:hypothetical protein
MASNMLSLFARHIQNFSDANALELHWGYADRVVPCKNDASSCQYLGVVYHSNDLGMLYSGVFWATIGGTVLIWAILRPLLSPSRRPNLTVLEKFIERPSPPRSGLERSLRSFRSAGRCWLLPEFARPTFGHTTRLQVVILAVLVGYLTIWSFKDIVYNA